MPLTTILPRELDSLRTSGQSVELIDVRTPLEYREVHVDCARNVPLDTLDPARLTAGRDADGQPLYVICYSGSRAAKAGEQLLAAGLANVVSVEGGTAAWIAAGLPVVRDKKVVSLERQVRIAAGSLVLLGVLLGWLVHWGLFGLSAFVGAGLIFAGVTNTCGMGLLLARMPWNRSQPSCQACAVRKQA